MPSNFADYFQLIPPVFVAALLLLLCRKYWKEYHVPAKRLQEMLAAAVSKVASVEHESTSERRRLLDNVFKDGPFTHAWQEFQETLHDQRASVDGEEQVLRTRATVPSSYFFSTQSIVDTPLKTEFYKHLPGILTGIGIIGTFAGLMIGLYYFDASDPAKVQESVQRLLGGVRDAFIASGSAILAAMLVTVFEKHNLRLCLERLEKLTEAIDKLFRAGVGEEYLASLVRASEESSRQTRLLKDSLVTDLREMLQNLVDTQVRESLQLAETLTSSYRESGESLAKSISTSIEDSFREPLNKIADGVNKASGEQVSHVQNLLQDVLVAFMSELKGTFGNQFHGMSEMMEQSVSAMQNMQVGFETLIRDMKAASIDSGKAVQEQLAQTLADMQRGQGSMHASMNEMVAKLEQAVSSIGSQGEAAGERMAEQLQKLFAESEARQQAMAEQLQAFVDGVKESVGQGQQDTMSRISSTVDQLGGQLGSLLETFANNRQQMDSSAQAAQQQLQDGTREIVQDLNHQVQSLLSALQEERSATQSTIKELGDQTARNLNGMQEGADKMRLAAERFEAAGDSVKGSTESTGLAVQQINRSAGELSSASSELGKIVSDYRINRDSIEKMLTTLDGMLASAQAEAGMRGQVVQDIQSVAERMQFHNTEASQFLEKVCDLLGKSFDQFGAGVERSLSGSLGKMDAALGEAVERLAGGLSDFNDGIEELSDTVEKAVRARH